MKFDKEYFSKQKFQESELKKYIKAINNDLRIARNSNEIEVKFHFTYTALIKVGIYIFC